jgi:hypothetical protein
MNAKLINLARIWGTGIIVLFEASLALSILIWPGCLILYGLRAAHVSLDVRQWVALAYGVLCAPFLAFYVSRWFGIRVRKIPVTSKTKQPADQTGRENL